MILGIDAGHGMSNAVKGRFDPGAVTRIAGFPVRESDITLAWSMMLRDKALARGHTCVMVRSDDVAPAPVAGRATYYDAHKCDALISFHCNASVNAIAHGTETLYFYSPLFAEAIQRAAVTELGLKSRGIKQRDNLALLKGFKRPAALLELGFITNADDLDVLRYPPTIEATCAAILRAIEGHVRA